MNRRLIVTHLGWAVASSAVVVLLCGLCGVALAQQARSGPPPRAGQPPAVQQILGLLPEDNTAPGWTRSGDARAFGPEDLFEYIDGAAEGYLAYGFQHLVTARYRNPQKLEAAVDIYRMKDARNAFGIYASERNPKAEFRTIGVEGYLGRTALNFWARQYYVKVMVYRDGAGAREAMAALAERCSRKIGGPGAPPPELRWFPTENRVEHSIQFLARDVLGHTFLPEGFEAAYRQNGAEVKLVIVALADAASAAAALAKYRQFAVTSGKVERDLKAPADGGFAGKDGFYGNVVAVRAGGRLLIALGGSSPDAASALISAALRGMGR